MSNKAVGALQVAMLDPCIVEIFHALCSVGENTVLNDIGYLVSLCFVVQDLPR